MFRTGILETPFQGINVSTLFNPAQYPQNLARSDAPSGTAFFISGWSQVAYPGPAPYTLGNADMFLINSSNWYLESIVGNMSNNGLGSITYNANTSLFVVPSGGDPSGDVYINDYTFFLNNETGWLSEAMQTGWVWTAIQVIVGASAFTFRQWIKFGTSGFMLGPIESDVTYASIRATLVTSGWTTAEANAWSPANVANFQIADYGDPRVLSVYHIRVASTSTQPTNEVLDAMACTIAPDATAWGDWIIDFKQSGTVDLTDQSGNGRTLILTGAPIAGPLAPNGSPVTSVTYLPPFAQVYVNNGATSFQVWVPYATYGAAYLLLAIGAYRTSGSAAESVTSVTGYGLTWSKIAGGSPSGHPEMTCEFWGAFTPKALDNSSVVTVTLSNTSQIATIVYQLDNVSGVGSPVGASVSPATIANNLSVTISGLTAGSRTFAIGVNTTDTETLTAGANTVIDQQNSGIEIISATNPTSSSSNTMSTTGYTGSPTIGYAAVEILQG
jgi:hypothetical protein